MPHHLSFSDYTQLCLPSRLYQLYTQEQLPDFQVHFTNDSKVSIINARHILKPVDCDMSLNIHDCWLWRPSHHQKPENSGTIQHFHWKLTQFTLREWIPSNYSASRQLILIICDTRSPASRQVCLISLFILCLISSPGEYF